MYKIESLVSDNQVWFLEEISKMIDKGKYEIIHLNTLIDSADNVVFTAILKKNI